ncbi:Aminoacyl-tRNA synthetase class 1a anticodon-binding [Penicillium chermesinum]|nr:Aminoacyl-tRNA synthetase class 1a anticodon-binding [Penicillium chermesinum]
MRPGTAFARSLVRDWSGQSCQKPAARLLSTTVSHQSRLRARLEIPPPFPVTKTCPEPTCDCPPTPSMPEGLPIDHDQPLNGTMVAYAQQLLICTGQRDWTSRIEDDGETEGWGNMVRGLKTLLGRGGPYLDDPTVASALLFPSFKFIPSIPAEIGPNDTDLTTFIRAFLLPEKLHSMHGGLPEDEQARMTRVPDLASKFTGVLDIAQSPTVLICGHGGRDMRCGVMAPVLEQEFQRVLLSQGYTATGSDGAIMDAPNHANLGLISHIGGHKYAGNVIVYIPPGMTRGVEPHPLAGKGIWYGRIEPKHVQGIVDETILGGEFSAITSVAKQPLVPIGNKALHEFRRRKRIQRDNIPRRNTVALLPSQHNDAAVAMQSLLRIRLTSLPPARVRGGARLLPRGLSSKHVTRFAATTSNTARLDLPSLDRKWQAKWHAEPASSQAPPDRPKADRNLIFYQCSRIRPAHYIWVTSDPAPDGLGRFWAAGGECGDRARRGPGAVDRAKYRKMKEQLQRISVAFDWDRELATCAPEFYEHTQRIFLMLHEKGLAYQAEALVNYDPVDKTVLANEQVDANGFSWRSGAKVEKLNLKQWFFRITAFKEALLKDLDTLSGGWPERVLSMQRNWLGKSQGAKVKFPVTIRGTAVHVDVFTTRPDTLYGVEYVALSSNHPIVLQAAENDPSLTKFLAEASSLPPDSKAGYLLNDVHASHPLVKIDNSTEHLKRKLPVFVAPYVLSDYGEGAVMGVPGHDARDMAFFRENVNYESIPFVIEPASTKDVAEEGDRVTSATAFTQEGILTSRCGKYQGLHSKEAAQQIVGDLQKEGQASFVESWRLRDWLISRQRYWGTPIPIIHCSECGPVPVPKEDLPVMLPKIEGEWLKGKKGNPLESSHEWLNTECPSCGGPAKRDTDTMDTFVDSSWYYLRFLDAANKDSPFSSSVARPVDIYLGGVEHAILHLLYARFIYKFLAQSELFPSVASERLPHEPFKTLLSQGMVHGKTLSDPSTGRFLHPDELDLSNPDKPLIKGTQVTPSVSFEKMSKSKHNGVDPTACATNYGADATRAHVLFSAPVSEVLEWDESKIVGIERWFGRLWKLIHDTQQTLSSSSFTVEADSLMMLGGHAVSLPSLDELSDSDADAVLATHKTISSVTACIESNPYGLNTVISDLIKLTNALSSAPPSSPIPLYLSVSSLLRLLAPIAPALASESWEVLHTQIISSPGRGSPW